MPNVMIRYYEELNDFLPEGMRKTDITVPFTGKRSVKDLIESMGVPHVEVDIILVNGASVDFEYLLCDMDRISVFPVFETLDISGVTRLRESPLRDTKFILDMHLGSLARLLRLLGFDTDYEEERDDDLLAAISADENRILLTCDRRLLMRKIVSRGIIIRDREPEKQILEVLRRLQLRRTVRPFTRCIECNGIIRKFDIDSPEASLLRPGIPEGVLSWCKEYYICTSCGKIYWKGSHYDKLVLKVKRLLHNMDRQSPR